MQVESGTVDSVYAEKGGDVIVKIGSSNIRLKNKAEQTINMNVTSQSYTYTEIKTFENFILMLILI